MSREIICPGCGMAVPLDEPTGPDSNLDSSPTPGVAPTVETLVPRTLCVEENIAAGKRPDSDRHDNDPSATFFQSNTAPGDDGEGTDLGWLPPSSSQELAPGVPSEPTPQPEGGRGCRREATC